MKKYLVLIPFCCLLLLGPGLAATPSPHGKGAQPRSGIFQLIENRAGRESCWGVFIQLSKARFKKLISPDQIVIRDGKGGHDLRATMRWSVDRTARQLLIKFKPGMGDFGTGNSVEIQIDRSAFLAPMQSPNKRFDWSISTDIL